LRLSPRQVGVLAAVVHSSSPDTEEPAVRELLDAGLLRADGAVPAALVGVAVAAAGARVQMAVTRLACGGRARVGITWGEDGIVVMRQLEAATVGDVVVQPPVRLGRTIWRIMQLGHRPTSPERGDITVDIDALLAPFIGGSGAWVSALGIDPTVMVLNRVDALVGPHRPALSWALLDGGPRGLWEVASSCDHGHVRLSPTDPVAAYAAITALQPRTESR